MSAPSPVPQPSAVRSQLSPLMQNALESIEIGLEDYASGQSKRITSALRNLFAGVLLMLKEKLRRLDPALISKQLKLVLDAAGKVKVEATGKQTVDVEQILERFRDLGIQVNEKPIRRLQQLRNNAEHLAPSHPPKVVQEAIASVFAVVAQFLFKELELVPADVLEPSAWQAMLDESETFKVVEQDCAAARRALDVPDAARVLVDEQLECPACGSELLKPGTAPYPDCDFTCHACGEVTAAQGAVEKALQDLYRGEAYEAAKEGYEAAIGLCPTCSAETFVIAEDICFICSEGRPYDRCLRCDESLSLSEQDLGGLCNYCEHMSKKDD